MFFLKTFAYNTLSLDYATIFSKMFSDFGRSSINPRIVMGSHFIKHKLKLSVEYTVQVIEKKPYLWFFLELDEFSPTLHNKGLGKICEQHTKMKIYKSVQLTAA